MKFNWKIALMGIATLAFVACNNNKPDTPDNPEDPGDQPYEQQIFVNDNSLDDWANVPAEFIVEAKCPADAALLGLKSVKVYADEYYIFIQAEPNMDDVTDLEWVPFHVYLNTDNSDATGGYGDEFTDANSDICLEGAVFGSGAAIPYAPGVFKWWGEVGGSGWEWTDPSVEHTADDGWGAIVAEGNLQGTTSQFVNGKFEIQIMREMVPATWSEEAFGIGFDIQQNWSSVGVLPLVSPTDDNANGYTKKLTVKIDK